MSIYQNGEYLKKNPDWHASDSPWKVAQINRMITKNALPFSSIVEVGCGAGRIISDLAKLYPSKEMVGYDISPDVSGFWPKFPPRGLRFVNADFQNATETYDILLLIDVFEHIENYIDFLKKMRGRSRYSMFHIPLDMSVVGLLRNKQIEARAKLGHLHYFSKDTALETLSYCGFRVLDWCYTSVAIEVPSHMRLRRRLMNLLRRPIYAARPDLAAKVLGGWSVLVLAESGTPMSVAAPAADHRRAPKFRPSPTVANS